MDFPHFTRKHDDFAEVPPGKWPTQARARSFSFLTSWPIRLCLEEHPCSAKMYQSNKLGCEPAAAAAAQLLGDSCLHRKPVLETCDVMGALAATVFVRNPKLSLYVVRSQSSWPRERLPAEMTLSSNDVIKMGKSPNHTVKDAFSFMPRNGIRIPLSVVFNTIEQ